MALDSLLAHDFQAINAADQVLDKASVFPTLRQVAGSLIKAADDSIRVRRYGDVAIMTLRETITARTPQGPDSGRLRMTEVWVRRSGRWQALGAQATALPAVPPGGQN